MPDNLLEARRAEFFDHVWNHAEDPFQAQFDERKPLTEEEVAFLLGVLALVQKASDDQDLGRQLRDAVAGSPERLRLLLQICGLTRNKIITDLKAAVASRTPPMKFPSSYKSLARSNEAWELAGPYLAGRARRVVGVLPGGQVAEPALEALNQGTWPGWIRQERAKRSGHHGEYRLATLLAGCSIPFEPKEKAEKPITKDIQIHGVSFDLVVPNAENPKVCVKATVHTSNIGQYGESKDHLEVQEASKILAERFLPDRKPVLLTLIDGIGFNSNRAGLDGVLTTADEFCQYRTLWKAVVVCAARLGITIRLELPAAAIDAHRPFLQKYGFLGKVVPKEKAVEAKIRLPAGDGAVLLDRQPSE